MIEIEINHHCNRACSYCPNSTSQRIEKGEMDRDLFTKLMHQLSDVNYRGQISYEFYNEPMLAKNYRWFVQTTREFLPYVTIDFYTNGTLLTIDRFRELINDGVNRFIVTKHEGVENYVFDKTYLELTENEKMMTQFKSFTDLKLTNRGGAVDAGPPSPANLTPCFIPEFLITVTVKGNVLPCFEDFHQENIMGNVGTEHIRDIWHNEKFNYFRKQLRQGLRHTLSPCNKCNRVQVCYDNTKS